VVLLGLTGEHANPTGPARRFRLRPLTPLARYFTVHLANRKPGLAAGSTTAVGGRLVAALLWLAGPRMRPADPVRRSAGRAEPRNWSAWPSRPDEMVEGEQHLCRSLVRDDAGRSALAACDAAPYVLSVRRRTCNREARMNGCVRDVMTKQVATISPIRRSRGSSGSSMIDG
jgi:hypothetical protein